VIIDKRRSALKRQEALSHECKGVGVVCKVLTPILSKLFDKHSEKKKKKEKDKNNRKWADCK